MNGIYDTVEEDDLDLLDDDIGMFDNGEAEDEFDDDIDMDGEGDEDDDFLDDESEAAERMRGRSSRWRRRAYLNRQRRKQMLMRNAQRRRQRINRNPYYSRRPGRYPVTQPKINRVATAVKDTRAAVKNVALKNDVKTDILASTSKKQRNRTDRIEYAMAATMVVNELKEQFPKIGNNKILNTALPLAPLALLLPYKNKKENGIQQLMSDPRMLGAAITFGIVAFKHYQGKADDKLYEMEARPMTVEKGRMTKLDITLKNANGDEIPVPGLIYRSTDLKKVEVLEGAAVIGHVSGAVEEVSVFDPNTSTLKTIKVTVS